MKFFTNFYKKLSGFFKLQEDLSGNVKDVARSRLKLVLMQDRTNLTPKILEQMRGELVDLLSKYVELDKEMLELNFEQVGDQVALMLSIPVIRAKDEKEIEEALKKDALLKGIQLADDDENEDTEINSTDENNIEDTASEKSIIDSGQVNIEAPSADNPKTNNPVKEVSEIKPLKEEPAQ